MDKLQRLLGY